MIGPVVASEEFTTHACRVEDIDDKAAGRHVRLVFVCGDETGAHAIKGTAVSAQLAVELGDHLATIGRRQLNSQRPSGLIVPDPPRGP